MNVVPFVSSVVGKDVLIIFAGAGLRSDDEGLLYEEGGVVAHG